MGTAIVAWGMTGVLIKAIDMGAIAIAFWRFLVYATFFSAYLRARGVHVNLSVLRRTLPGGLCLAGDVMLFFTAVKYTNIVNATTIGALQPLILAVVAVRLFGETVRRREIIIALVAIAGVVVVVVESAGTPEWSPGGDLAAVGALLCWSAYWVFAKRSHGTITPMEYTAGTGWWTAIVALPVGLLVGTDMSVPALDQWLPLLGLVLVGGVLGHGLMNWAIVRVPLWLGYHLHVHRRSAGLATYSLLPIVQASRGRRGVEVETRDISLAGRILAAVPRVLTEDQRSADDLAELGELRSRPRPTSSSCRTSARRCRSSRPRSPSCRRRATRCPTTPTTRDRRRERDIKARYDKVKGSAVNPVLREGNSDRRAPAAVKEYARKHPHSMGKWSPDSKTHVATWARRLPSQRAVGDDGRGRRPAHRARRRRRHTTVLKPSAGAGRRGRRRTVMREARARAFLAEQIADAKASRACCSRCTSRPR
jgi:drug/metabolite transporter (DMT)-like permease